MAQGQSVLKYREQNFLLSQSCSVQGAVLQPIRPSLWISTSKAENQTNSKKLILSPVSETNWVREHRGLKPNPEPFGVPGMQESRAMLLEAAWLKSETKLYRQVCSSARASLVLEC